METYISHEELSVLTSYQQPRKQIDWLREMGWVFVIGGDLKPKVLRAYHDKMLSGEDTSAVRAQPAYGVFDGRSKESAGRPSSPAVR